MIKPFGALVALAIVPCLAMGQQWKVNVEAGKVDREGVPVHVDLELPADAHTKPACVEQGTSRYPAQLEKQPGGKTRVWWVVDQLAKGKSEPATIKLGVDCADGKFEWKEEPGKWTQLRFDGSPLASYMHESFDPERIEETKKVYHHVFRPDGKRLITKGLGGKFPHHRGIFFGYNRITAGDRKLDIWHARKGEHQAHREIVNEFLGPVFGGHELRIDWNDREGKTFLEETRMLRVFPIDKETMLIDFRSELAAVDGPVRLEGDRQHAGVQFRAAQALAESNDGRYLRPEKWSDMPANKQFNGPDHKDLPWNALQYKLDGEPITVAYLSDPKNPDNAEFSERGYGRFGEYFPYEVTAKKPLRVHYRFWVSTNEKVTREQIERQYQDMVSPPSVVVE
ncbi:hypothetical protein Pan216_33730 [Planctomycetes bacterium Pan216]|uniref:Methane oxygenase PmoA n=1 Tax=Kolteria novifilia TaxID=2527975 RepID=A0A518B6B6_9BACT|nr:hypothetical protein Pan216_33730 [Planctomycetes bacterium Pan216]